MTDDESEARALWAAGQLADAALAFARAALGASSERAAALRVDQAACWAELGERTRAIRALQKAINLVGSERCAQLVAQHPRLETLLP